MKKMIKFSISLITVLVLGLVFPLSVFAAPIEDDRTVLGSSYTLKSGRILDGNLIVIGGVVDIEEDASITGDMFVLGGLVNIDGTIEADLIAVGGTVTLEENAVVEGNLVSPGSYISLDKGAIVQGDLIQTWDIPWTDLELPMINQHKIIRTPRVPGLSLLNTIGQLMVSTLIIIALGALMLLVMPKTAETMTAALTSEPWHVLGYGALTAFVMLFGGLLLSITICLIPVVILAGLAFSLSILAGWLALGYELGKRMAESIFKTTWHPVLSATLGNLVLYLVARSVGLIPCLGWSLVFVAMLFGLGMAIVTLFGTIPYPRNKADTDEEQIILNENEEIIDQEMPITEALPEEVSSADRPVADLGLSSRVTDILKQAGLETISDVLNQLNNGDQAMLEISGFGPKSLTYLKDALTQMGYLLTESSDLQPEE
ncbi:MAG: DNA-directed RNA polymerase subunit alpha C-terminal domain-containing protein [Chloroflexota bacterium]|nr:DNA-directed RNA polymerase subunit alpha C-terminal domain-containing protein [Chloroflexota bacterium]